MLYIKQKILYDEVDCASIAATSLSESRGDILSHGRPPSVTPPPVSTRERRTTPRRGKIKNSRTKRERVNEDPAALRHPSSLDLDGVEEGAVAGVGEDIRHA